MEVIMNLFQITKKSIENSNLEISILNKQSLEAKSATSSANSKLAELEAHLLVLAKLKHQEECETMKLEHSILKIGNDTRQILKDRIAAEKAALLAKQAAAMVNVPVEVKKNVKVPDQGPDSPSGDAMAQLEAEFLAEVEDAAGEFVETVPASQPPSPKNEAQIQEQHTIFETRKGFFTGRVEDAEIKFLMAMEAIEYGEARTKLGRSPMKMLAAAEKARLAAEALAKQLAEDAKRAQEEAARLQAELDRLQGMGSGDKRWKTENINIMLGEECLKPEDYKVQVVDKGVEINIDVDISGSVGGLESAMKEAQDEAKRLDEEMRKAQDEAKRLDEEMRKALDEAKHLDEEMRKAQDEAARLQAELDRLQGMGSGDKRWKTENVNVMVGEECLKPADYKVQVVDKGAEINIDVDISSSRTKELEGAMERAQDEAKRLRDEMRKAQEECDKLAAELARLKGMGSGGKRWKQETVTVVMGDKKLSKEEYKVEVLDKGAQIDIDVQIQGIGSKIEDELEAVKKNLLDEESSHLIKSNINELLQHLENIAEVVKPKSSQAGQSSQAGPSKRDGDIGGQN
jgi:hypothetical protein